MGRLGKKSTAEKASGALESAKQHEHEIRVLTNRVDRLTRILRAMMSLLEEQSILKQDDVHNLVKEIEEKELGYGGVKIHEAPECPNCSRPLQEGVPNCIYCGAEIEQEDALF